LAVAAVAEPSLPSFLSWAHQHGKKYLTSVEETQRRYDIFVENMAMIDKLNAQNLTWVAGTNEFTDMTSDEFAAGYTIQLPPRMKTVRVKATRKPQPNDDIDWRTKGAVGPVHNQGASGAVSSFVAADSVAAWYVINNASKPAYVDLSWDQITAAIGINNWPANGVQYASVAGLCTQAGFARDRDRCQRVCTPNTVDISESERELWEFTTKVPSTVAIQVESAFQFYTSGIFAGPCAKQWNHALLIVGGTTDYWIAKNSWGSSWGEQGYVRIKRGDDVCGLSFEEAIPI